jgi:glycogen operon protein
VVNFKLPAATGGKSWTLRADTNFPDATEEPEFEVGHVYAVTARSLLLFQLT